MLYGVHGIGKSTFGAMPEKPIFLPTEEGLGEIDCASFPLLTGYDQVIWLSASFTPSRMTSART